MLIKNKFKIKEATYFPPRIYDPSCNIKCTRVHKEYYQKKMKTLKVILFYSVFVLDKKIIKI